MQIFLLHQVCHKILPLSLIYIIWNFQDQYPWGYLVKTSQYGGGPMSIQFSGIFCAPKLTSGFVDLEAQFFYLESNQPAKVPNQSAFHGTKVLKKVFSTHYLFLKKMTNVAVWK